MKLSDTLAGLLAIIFGISVAAYARSFPSMPGQSVGPALFPTVIGIGFVVFGTALLLTDLRRVTGSDPVLQGSGVRPRPGGGRRQSWIERDDWAHRPRMVLNFALVLADLLFYAVAVDRLGFFITAVMFLTVLFVAFGVKRTWIAPLAIGATLLIHYGFYTLLRVPLPWGPLEGIAW